MPDISMCADDGCPVRFTCRRHEASGTKPGPWQTWMMFEHTSDQGFWARIEQVAPVLIDGGYMPGEDADG